MNKSVLRKEKSITSVREMRTSGQLSRHDKTDSVSSWKTAWALCILWVATTIASPAQTLTTLTTFDGTNGSDPNASLVQGTDGNFYGTTVTGGNRSCNAPFGCGTVFTVSQSGTLTTLHSFCTQANCTDGSVPTAGLVLGTDAALYGGAGAGGAHGGGTIFRITPQGELKTLYSFCAQAGCADGAGPSTLIEASNGDFYGTSGGGAHGFGTVFKITRQGKLTTLYSFCGQSLCADGSDPVGGLVRGTDGNLYGTTYSGGAFGYGTVFKIVPGGKLTTLHSFDSTDGANPTASLIQAKSGGFFGSTSWGGTVLDTCPIGCGTLFRISSTGKLTTLDNFDWSNGYEPHSALVQATDGNLYGTTVDGLGVGTIFNVALGGSNLTILSAFNGGLDGLYPFGGIVQATHGVFYGTTAGDGSSSNGTVYSLNMGLGSFITFVLPSGKVGQTAEILGQGLTGTTSVTFNGVTATSFTVRSDTYMTAVVPIGATTGSVVVTTPTGTLTSNVIFRITK